MLVLRSIRSLADQRLWSAARYVARKSAPTSKLPLSCGQLNSPPFRERGSLAGFLRASQRSRGVDQPFRLLSDGVTGLSWGPSIITRDSCVYDQTVRCVSTSLPRVSSISPRRERWRRSSSGPVRQVSAGISKQPSRCFTRSPRRGLSSETSRKKPVSRISFRDSLRSPVKAARFTVQSGRDLVEWARHMWAGFRLLAADVRGSWKVLAKISHGKAITRRERNFLVQTGVDLGRLVPFSLFLIVPLAEFALPIALRVFPNMLPSQFQSQMQKEENMKRQLKANLELAKYLRDVVEKQAKMIKSSDKDSAIKQEAAQLAEFLKAVRSGQQVNVAEVSRFARLFSDELTLDGAVRPQLVAMAKYMGISAHGTDQLLRFRLRSRLNSIKSDDMQITWEGGADSLTDEEVVKACADRGIRSVGVSNQELRAQLSSWLVMSQDKAVPGSLMIMSRAFLYTGDEDGLKETLSSLPDGVYEDVTMEAGGGDGNTIDRLEEARRQSKLIELESEREARKDKEEAELKQRLEDEKASTMDASNVSQEASVSSSKGMTASESIADANVMAAATANEAKIIAEHFEARPSHDTEQLSGDVKTSNLLQKSPDMVDTKSRIPGEADNVDESPSIVLPVTPGVSDELTGSVSQPPKDEEQLAKERDALRRVLDHLRSFSSESAVEKERVELEKLKDELEEAESLLQSLGAGNESELARFKKMVAKLEKQVEAVDAKLGASMRLLDLDNDGRMQFGEIVDAINMLTPDEGDAVVLTEALRRLDADSDGTVTRDDITRLLKELEVETAGLEVATGNGITGGEHASGASSPKERPTESTANI